MEYCISEFSNVHENAIWPFQGLLILTNINMTLLRWILREPVFSGHPVLIRHTNGFESALKQQHGLYYLTVKTTGTPVNTRLDIAETEQGIKATISPVTMTPTGAKWVTHNNDIWIYNSQGFLVRLHKRQRQATYVPDKQCPVPMDKLQDYRRTIAH